MTEFWVDSSGSGYKTGPGCC